MPDDLLLRIRRVTEELEAIDKDIADALGSAQPERHLLVEALAAGDSMQHFKRSVDSVRNLVWAVIEAAAQESRKASLSCRARALLLDRAASMLRSMRQAGLEEMQPPTF